MRNLKYIVASCLFIFIAIACNPDDDSTTVAVRDRQEVDLEDQLKLSEYLETHFYYEVYPQNPVGDEVEIKFDTISGANANQTPLSQQVTESFLSREGIDYKIYTLKLLQGSGDKSPTFADSALVSYKGLLLENDDDGNQILFDSSVNSVWFDLPSVVPGFAEGVSQFNGASTITQLPDNTFSYQGSGLGAVFLPSGLGYFSATISRVPAYSPLIFTFQLRSAKTTDHDGDGVFSKFEDLDGDRNLRSSDNADNTDEDTIGAFNYIDADDDNDGVDTIDENADPNGDGDPSDALDTDGDGVPDYLDADTAIAVTT
ncbi:MULTISPECIES: FKBP-type peptidyl-prolyl cis-trans isomerase [Nonlabens]|uniref:peptidylprolyl isomerase n=1 Tax=Nonlabens ulvanivorans TaxID=906888 RepID=A0A081D983_NONUL|nr:peptidylprolyl isomerase [Nonlabens ulvanivorans]GAK75479.1 calcium-binding protein [Nonlabens ulvanivorans]GAL01887.1 FKBP-type peptidyl-prolyl cis-trans isomerase FkpA precursor [Nonlabens ulvanivorans]